MSVTCRVKRAFRKVASPARLLLNLLQRCLPLLTTTNKHLDAAMDRQSVYSLSLFGDTRSANGEESVKQAQREIVKFILEFHLDGVYVYRYGRRRCRGLSLLTFAQRPDKRECAVETVLLRHRYRPYNRFRRRPSRQAQQPAGGDHPDCKSSEYDNVDKRLMAYIVRSCSQDMHTAYPLPITKRRRPCPSKSSP